jgi:hypothetical protein
MAEKMFPICLSDAQRLYEDIRCPTEIPWRLIEPLRARAEAMYASQTLETLAKRGGLAPDELMALVEDRPARWVHDERAIRFIHRMLAEDALRRQSEPPAAIAMTDEQLLEEIKRRARECVHADQACRLVYFINNTVDADAPWRDRQGVGDRAPECDRARER